MQLISGRHMAAARKLSARLGVKLADVLLVLEYGATAFYDIYPKAKRSGGFRIIREPLDPLKSIQEALLASYFEDLPVSPIAHGCLSGRGIDSNAFPHRHSRSMVAFDLKDAYNQVCFENCFIQARRSRRKQPWDVLPLELCVLEIVARIVDFREEENSLPFLPQGTSTSPALFNFACRSMDARLEKLANNVGGVVTRFADNIVFSWGQDEVAEPVCNALRRIITKNSFVINPEKTFTIRNGNCNGVPLRLPGVHIIDGELRLPRQTKKHMRMALYCAGKSGNSLVYQGVRGHAIQVEADIPAQLQGVYQKAQSR